MSDSGSYQETVSEANHRQDTADSQVFQLAGFPSSDEWVASLGVLSLLVVFWSFAGPFGGILWFIISCCWLLTRPLLPIAIGQFALIGLLPTGPPIQQLVIGELPFLVMMVGDIDITNGRESAVLIGFVAIIIGTLQSYGTDNLLLSSILSIGLGFFLSYVLYRYLKVVLDQTPGE